MMKAVLLMAWFSAVSCGIQHEVGYQTGRLVCDGPSQCPDELFCDNYFNTYVYFTDVTAASPRQGEWGFCNHRSERIEHPAGVPAEDCFNGADEDADGLVDCLDPECQTAPACRAMIERECAEGASGALCDDRLGFPVPRDGGPADETNCPGAVGVIHTNEGGALAFCLPRCRLYFPDMGGNPSNSTDEDFAGSDAYCAAVAPLHGTIPAFTGTPRLRCQHLGVVDNGMYLSFQQDACLPGEPDLVLESSELSPPVETCEGVCGGSDCLRVSYKRREWSKVVSYSSGSEIVMIEKESQGNDPERYLQTAFYCLD